MLKNSLEPVRTKMKLVSGHIAYIDDESQLLKTGDSIKITLRKNIRDIFIINAIVLSVALNRKKAKIRLGYIDESVKLSEGDVQ